MYDTISCWKEFERRDSIKLTKLDKIECSSKTFIPETKLITYSGKLKNLRVKWNDYGVSIFGSINKFYHGNNIVGMTRQNTQRAVEELSDLLGLAMDEAKVYRIDLAQNFVMKKPLINYYICLGEAKYLTKTTYKEGLMYANSLRAIVFYDKVKEMSKKKEIIPKMFNNTNVLRYEVRFNKRLKNQFKQPQIIAKTLYDETFYISIIDKWKKYYFSINRLNKIKFQDNMIMKDVRQFTLYFALIGIKSVGENEVFEMIEGSKDELSKMQYSRLKKKATDLMSHKDFTEPNDSLKELDTKIRNAVRHYR